MPEDANPSLITQPDSGLARVAPQGGGIVAAMVSEALAQSRQEVGTSLVATSGALLPKFRIGDYEWCEPDYQQILLWANALKIKPETVIDRLLIVENSEDGQRLKTQFKNGRIINICWDAVLLPIKSLEWVDGLVIESLAIPAPSSQKQLRIPSLPLPQLRGLYCRSVGLSRLDLSQVPLLTELSCGNNRINILDLTVVPLLRKLRCHNNQLIKLDLASVSELTMLDCSDNNLKKLDLTQVSKLTALECSNINLKELDLTHVPQLTMLECSINNLKELNLTHVPQITTLFCVNNKLRKLDLTGVSKLTSLCCDENRLTELNLTHVPNLNELSCKSNELEILNIRSLQFLENLWFDDSKTILLQRSDQDFYPN